MKTKVIYLFSFLIAILLLTRGLCEIYYVSPNGSSKWKDARNIKTPCSPKTAMYNAKAGDIVYFLEGIYNLGKKNGDYFEGVLEPKWSGKPQKPIIFKAYPGATVILNATAGGKGDDPNVGTVLASYGKDYIIFDGFIIMANNGYKTGRIVISNGQMNRRVKNCIVKNCIIVGSINSSGDNIEGLRVNDSSYTLIQNCVLYGFTTTTGSYNTSAIKTYHNDHLIIENCEIYNSLVGIYLKSYTENSIIRYNYIHNNFIGIRFTTSDYPCNKNKFYHNILAHNKYNLTLIDENKKTGTINDTQIFNNTIYSFIPGAWGVFISHCARLRFYNNIVCTPGHQFVTGYRNVAETSILEMDYNLFCGTPFEIIINIYPGVVFKSLYEWQESRLLINNKKPDIHSIVSDPEFVNISKHMNNLFDFALKKTSPCIGKGKNGTNIGADINL